MSLIPIERGSIRYSETEKARNEPGLSRLAISAADPSNEPARCAGLRSAIAVWRSLKAARIASSPASRRIGKKAPGKKLRGPGKTSRLVEVGD